MNPTLSKVAANLKRRTKIGVRASSLPAVWVMTDDQRLSDPESVLATLPRGTGLILRHYGAQTRTALAQRLATACRQRGLILLIAGDWRLAAKVGAAGVHLPEHMARQGLAPGGRLWRKHAQRLATTAAHNAAGLRRAQTLKASAVLLSPIFATASHPTHTPIGTTRAALLLRGLSTPAVALGGVTAASIKGLRSFAGIAGIGFAKKTD